MDLEHLIRVALNEDIAGNRDMTSDLFVGAEVTGTAWIEAREDAVVSGLPVVAAVFAEVDPGVKLQALVMDGARVVRLQRVMELSGPARSILKAERTALNFLTHLSGVATHTRRFVDVTAPWKTTILCTRKTLPGLRALEIAAVRHGGGDAYRTNLTDAVLLKDNHLGILGGMDGVRRCLEDMRRTDEHALSGLLADGKIEAGSLDELEKAVAMGWSHVLLDNFTPADVAEAVKRHGNAVYLEMSGGVNLSNAVDYASTGVHAISVGALTHSSKAVDFSLEVEWNVP
ncbi:MAG TPA: carboxylating nicotinate-nucleotide diphosphorylase [bacterium]|jgi:nicotinate-nucleotide pyrophosphorylase (carboxylating)